MQKATMYILYNKNKALWFAGIIAAFLLGGRPAEAAEIKSVRFGVTSASETRLVFDLDGAPNFDFIVDPKDETRLTIVFADASLASRVAPAGPGAGQFRSYAAMPVTIGRLHVAFSLSGSARLKQAFVIPPSSSNTNHRLVVDIERSAPGQMAASLPARKFQDIADVIASVAPPSASTPAASAPSLASERLGADDPITETTPRLASLRPVIVIDAGHGGSDPGAGGPTGVKESEVTLSAALTLAEILRKTGRYEVVLTRSKDVRLAHEERSRIARDAKAGLFISLHADAHTDPKVRGGSVYTLSDEGTERSAREALAKGNYVVHDLDIAESGKELGGILYGLAQRDTANASDRFAELLIDKMSGATPLLNNTHRRGNFKVLLAPDVPAVLLELAFISNKRDESNLQSPVWRTRTMAAAAAAIDAYFQQRGMEKHASNVSTMTR